MIGFRSSAYKHGTFISPHQGVPWDGKYLQAKCDNGCTEIPSFGKWDHSSTSGSTCWCGIHISYWLETACAYVGRYAPIVFPSIVEGFGRCVDHDMGFRCEQAEIIGLVKVPYERPASLELKQWDLSDEISNLEHVINDHFMMGSLIGQRDLVKSRWEETKKYGWRYLLMHIEREMKILDADLDERLEILRNMINTRDKLLNKISLKYDVPVYEEADAILMVNDWLKAEGRYDEVNEGTKNSNHVNQQSITAVGGLEGVNWKEQWDTLQQMKTGRIDVEFEA
jgi:hypothetical protein